MKYLGAHVSTAGGVHTAPQRAQALRATASRFAGLIEPPNRTGTPERSEVTGRVHSGMQHAHDEDAICILRIEHDVRSVLETPQAGCEPVRTPAQSRMLCEVTEASIEIVPVSTRLHDAETLDRVVRYFGEISFGPSRQAIVSQAWCCSAAQPPPRSPSPSCR